MLYRIDENLHPDHSNKFKNAVSSLLPILCYTPEEADAFLAEFANLYDGHSYAYEDSDGDLTFCRLSIQWPMGRSIQYILPSVWRKRYAMVKETLVQIQLAFLEDNSEHELRMKIDEQIPSRNAYYAGLLPDLGFDLTPRLVMVANQKLLERLELPVLPDGIRETGYTADRLQEHIEMFHRAHRVNYEGYPEEEIASMEVFWQQYMPELYETDASVKTWTALEHEGKLIGASCGGLWDDEMGIEEVAILPEFAGMGLGRYLTIRCMQKLWDAYGGPEKYFGLGTNRTYIRALKLYHRLGFKIDKIETYATFRNHRMSAEE